MNKKLWSKEDNISSTFLFFDIKAKKPIEIRYHFKNDSKAKQKKKQGNEDGSKHKPRMPSSINKEMFKKNHKNI